MSSTDLTGNSSKYRSILEIMQVPALQAVLSSYIDEALKCKTAIQTQQELLKGHREQACEELGIKPAVFNSYLDMMFKNDFAERLDKFEELHDMVRSAMEGANMSLTHNK